MRTSVVLVHGSNSDARIWADHVAIIAPHYHVHAVTQRYFGLSPWPDDGRNFSIQTHANDLAELIRSSAPVAVIGWSYGGAVSLTMTAQNPELVERLFLYEPVLPTDDQLATDDRVEMTREAKAAASRGELASAVQIFMDAVNDYPGTFRALPDRVQVLMTENARMLPLLFAAPPMPRIDLSRLTMPVTAAMGEDSRLFYRSAAQSVRGARLVTVPKARHLFPIQDPPAFSQLVLDFLK